MKDFKSRRHFEQFLKPDDNLTKMAALLVLALLVAPSLGEHLPLIIGGNDVATPGKYPHQGSLQFLGSHSCGCSLVSATWVITAGHCIISTLFQSVIMGAHDIKTETEGNPTTYSIKQAIVHPDFDMSGDGFPNDMALIKLNSAVDMSSEFIGTVEMAPSTATDEDYSNCVITGWGAIKMIGGIIPTMPNNLQEAAVGIYDPSTCLDMFAGVGGLTNETINAGHICVGEKELRGACSGDSGGPLVCQYKEKTVLVGLTSWGISTCNPKYPSVYTRVSHFRNFIDGIMNPGY